MPTPPPRDVFYWKPLSPEGRKAVVDAALAAHPGLKTPPEVQDFLSRITVPASLRWAFLTNDKCATSSTLRCLFQLEFGVPLTVALDTSDDINPDSVVHRLHQASVLRKLIELKRGVEILPAALRLTTVRHPATRALSAFFYLCATQDRKHAWMADDRLRMNAIVGFDWDTDCRTLPGHVKFLRYIDHSLQHNQQLRVNPHWRPQVSNIRPQVFRPDLVGRVEDMAPFFHQLAERLGQPLPAGWVEPRANSQPPRDADAFDSPEIRALIARIYQADFEQFGYDPDRLPDAP